MTSNLLADNQPTIVEREVQVLAIKRGITDPIYLG